MDFDPSTCALYKEYQKRHLAQCQTLEGFEAQDFYFEEESDNDMMFQLEEYTKRLTVYSKHLCRAAELRQNHYEMYIRGKCLEEEGHAAFRIGLNIVAEDSKEKLARWTKVKDEKFTQLLNEDGMRQELEQRTRKVRDIDLSIRNVDYNPKYKSKDVIPKPFNKKENDRLRRERKEIRRQLKMQKKNSLIEEENAVNNAIGECDLMKRLIREEFINSGGVYVSEIIRDLEEDVTRKPPSLERAFITRVAKKGDPFILIKYDLPNCFYRLAELYYKHYDAIKEDLLHFDFLKFSFFVDNRKFVQAFTEFLTFSDVPINSLSENFLVLYVSQWYFMVKTDICKHFKSHFGSEKFKSVKDRLEDIIDMFYGLNKTGNLFNRILELNFLLNHPGNADYIQERIQNRTFSALIDPNDTLYDQSIHINPLIMQMYLDVRLKVCQQENIDVNEFIRRDQLPIGRPICNCCKSRF